MIQYHLNDDDYMNFPNGNRYGVLTQNGEYAGYPMTIVDNKSEVVDGKYTRLPSLCLIHLSENVRQYNRLRIGEGFLYIHPRQEQKYRLYEYKKVELSKDDIIHVLKSVLYKIQPSLVTHSLVGYRSNRLEDDGNYYEGSYVLNDENEYTILKCRDQYKFYRGVKSYYPHWKNETEDLLYEGTLDFPLYSLALEVNRLRGFIVTKMNFILDNEEFDVIEKYKKINKDLAMLLNERDNHW